MRHRLAVAAVLAFAVAFPLGASAQTPAAYTLIDSASAHFQMGLFQSGGKSFPGSVSVDASGNPLAGAAGTTNPNGTGLFVQGVTNGVPLSITFAAPQHVVCDSGCSGGSGGGGAVFGPTAVGTANANPPIMVGGTADGTATGAVGILKVLGGSAFINCANCSGSGISVAFTGSIGNVGTPGGFKDASGNFQPLFGDTTFGQWVSIKASVPIAVTGTFFQATQPISAASLPLPANAATQTTSAAILSALGSPMQQSGGSVTANAGTNLNTSLLALESGGNLASINTKTPSLGQALAASSVPVVLTAIQQAALTPPAAITNFSLETGGNLASLFAAVGSGGSPAANTLQSRLATINTTLGTPFQAGGTIGNTAFAISGTLPAFAATPTFNLGTLNGAATATLQGTGNSSLSSIDGKTPALGQALAAASVPVVLTSAQLSTLTPLSTVTVQQPTGSNLHMTCDSGCSSSSSPSFGSTFPTTGTPIGMSQGGLLTAFTGTSGNLNVNVAAGAVTANAGTNLNTSLLALEAGGNLASIATNTGRIPAQGQALAAASLPVVLTALQLTTLTPPAAITGFALDTSVGTTNTDIGALGSTACATDNGSCNLNALLQRNNQRITSLITALGSPFQAGGTIGNTSFAATQATAANLNATVVGTGTFAVQAAQSGAYNITNISGTVSLPTGAAISANQPTNAAIASTTSGQTGGLMMGAVTTGAPTYTTAQTDPLSLDTAGNLRVNCVTGCSGGGGGGTSSNFSAAFPTAGTALGLSNGTNMVPWSATTNYGISPGAIPVPAINAAITNTVPVTLTSTTITGTVAVTQSTNPWVVALNTTPSLANGSGVVPTQGGAILSATNPSFTRLSDATTATVVKAASTAALATDPALVVAVSPNNTLPINITQVLGAANSATNGLFVRAGSGQFASGAYASGSIATGAIVDLAAVLSPLNAGTATATKGLVAAGQFLTTQPTMTNTQQASLLLSSRGEMLVAPGVSGFPVTSNPPAPATRNFPGCTVGASSAQCLAASTATKFVQVQNNSATASIACAWGATAVLNASGSFQLSPGQAAHWGVDTSGIPSAALNCIASAASTPMYLEWL